MVVEHAQVIGLRRGGVAVRGVVAEHGQLHPLERHHPVGLRPAAIVADAHAEDAALAPPDRPAEIAGLEIALLQMLPGAAPVQFRMARQMDLAVFANDPAPIHQNGGIVAVPIRREFAIAEIEGDIGLLRRLEQRAHRVVGHRTLEVPVHGGDVFLKVARKESGERHLGEHDQPATTGFRLAHEFTHAGNGTLAALARLDRPELRGTHSQQPAHDTPLIGSLNAQQERGLLDLSAPLTSPQAPLKRFIYLISIKIAAQALVGHNADFPVNSGTGPIFRHAVSPGSARSTWRYGGRRRPPQHGPARS